MIEEWKDVLENPDYKISSQGRVIRKERVVARRNQGVVIFPEIEVKTYKNKGYRLVNFRLNGKRYSNSVHRLVAKAFIPNSEPTKDQVNHIDGNKSNNHVSNLEWCTLSENRQHAYNTGLQKGLSGIRNPMNKYSEETIIEVKNLINKGLRNVEIQKISQISHKYISSIRRGRSWR